MAEITEIDQLIIALYSEGKWREIIDLTDKVNKCSASKSRLFWVLPTLSDLHFVNTIMKQYNLSQVMSVGCGCGLFEWLLQQYSGLNVIGVEVDEAWWHSRHAPPLFLHDVAFLKDTNARMVTIPQQFALLFCYFNNANAFVDYINSYKGILIFVIGPAIGEQRSTNPLPFDSRFKKHGWTLIDVKDITHSNDSIAAYTRNMIIENK